MLKREDGVMRNSVTVQSDVLALVELVSTEFIEPLHNQGLYVGRCGYFFTRPDSSSLLSYSDDSSSVSSSLPLPVSLPVSSSSLLVA